MTSTASPAATRIPTAELAWLLSLRPGDSATLVATALGIDDAALRGPWPTDDLVVAGRAQQLRSEVLPRGESAVVGDVLTSATAIVSIGTESALAALVVIGWDRALVVAPATAGIELAALEAGTPPAPAAAAIAARVGPGATVMVAVPGGSISAVAPGPDLATRIAKALP